MTTPHLDDEQLSAHFDGEESFDVRSHVDSCSTCRSRLAELAGVAALVGQPVPPPPDSLREAALAASRQAWADGRADTERPTRPTVVPLSGRRRLPRWALPVAAAAAVLVSVPVLNALRDSDDRSGTTFASDSGGSANKTTPEVAATDGGDLGDQSDPAILALAVRGALPGAASEAALAAPPSPAPATGEGIDDAAAPTTAPGMPARITGETTARGPDRPLANPPCASAGRTTYGKGLGPLVYAARLRWQGQPAVALAYRLADTGTPGLDYRVLVMATGGCRLLVVQSL